MAVIHVLDKHTAELIAAGEVVERPASVVKELTENAIDAGATAITVSIEHGGVSCIQITDNGSGIEPEYIATAFVRHATSKIETEQDLDCIHTLGFRGEALASVACVARLEVLTKTENDEFACLYRISGGKEESLEAAPRPVGTTITVRDLFYNTPARMKFLKKDVSEANYVNDIVTQLALSHPEISFKFIREGKVQFQTPGDGKLRGAVYAALSRDFAQDLVEVDFSKDAYAVKGCVTPPKSGRASRAMQFFFINGRFVKNRTMMAALEAAYKGLLMQGKYPGCVLSLIMPPQWVDVNVHPAKTEVRFAREKDVFDCVYQAVKGVLLTSKSSEKTIAFQNEKQPSAASTGLPSFSPEAAMKVPSFQPKAPGSVISAPVVARQTQSFSDVVPMAHPIQTGQALAGVLASEAVIPYQTEIRQTRASLDVPFVEDEKAITQINLLEQTQSETLRFVGEVFHTYIITQRGNELCFIDKHAAHERILYEALVGSYGKTSSQMLLCPVSVQLSAEEKNALLASEVLLADSGVEIEDFGGNSVVIRAVPADIVPQDIENLVIELASRLVKNPQESISEKTQWVLHSIACRGAIKAGDKTHHEQLLHLAQEVLDGNIPPFCPHGRPVVLKLTQKELEKQFGRQG